MVDYSLELWGNKSHSSPNRTRRAEFSHGALGEISVSEEGFYLLNDPAAPTGRSHARIVCLLGRSVRKGPYRDREGNLFGITEMKRLLTSSLLPRCLRLHLRRSFLGFSLSYPLPFIRSFLLLWIKTTLQTRQTNAASGTQDNLQILSLSTQREMCKSSSLRFFPPLLSSFHVACHKIWTESLMHIPVCLRRRTCSAILNTFTHVDFSTCIGGHDSHGFRGCCFSALITAY